ncbi:Ficolin-1 [Bulinus truncatus]|nr:Ficolin-1 [Bulinus truncatus]
MVKYNPCEDIKSQKSKAAPLVMYTSQGEKGFLCDSLTDGGRWIVIQKRQLGDTDFNRTWADYSKGFGGSENDFWLGNELIHQLTSWDDYELLIEMVYEGKQYSSKYDYFRIDSESSGYRLHVGAHVSGNAPDSFSSHCNYSFSTPDRDFDASVESHCARARSSGWWFHDCMDSNLNGRFVTGKWGQGLFWRDLTGTRETLNSSEMKMRYKSY